MEKNLKSGFVTVIGSEEKLKDKSGMFEKLEPLFH